MNLNMYSMKDVLLAAVKSEVESEKVYQALSERVENAFLKERLAFLAGEERKHKLFVEGLYEKTFPGTELVLPEKTPVPIPEMKIPEESVPLSIVFESAMKAEMKSHDFYQGLSEKFEDSSIKKTLIYFAAMEMNHYKILEAEHETMKRFEDFDVEWPMMNVGP